MVSFHYPRKASSFIARPDTPYRDPQRSNPVVESSVQLDHRCVRRYCQNVTGTHPVPIVTFGNLVGSLFFGAILVKCTDAFSPRLTLRSGSLITSYRQWHHLDRTIPQLRADVCLVGIPFIYTLTDGLTR